MLSHAFLSVSGTVMRCHSAVTSAVYIHITGIEMLLVVLRCHRCAALVANQT
jgi:hypothetical protein